MLPSHKKMLEAQIAQQASFPSTPSDRPPSKPEPSPHEHCNRVNLKKEVEDFTDPKDIPIEKGREIIMVESKDRNDGGKAATFIENENIDIPTVFSPKLSHPRSFSIPYIKGKVEIERAVYDLGAYTSLMPYSLFHKLQLGPL